jgi:hypothetical protein
VAAHHEEHETVPVSDWRISSYTIEGTTHVSAHYSAHGMSIAHYWTPEEARAWRDAVTQVLAAIP